VEKIPSSDIPNHEAPKPIWPDNLADAAGQPVEHHSTFPTTQKSASWWITGQNGIGD
jgi:hypothetical protein